MRCFILAGGRSSRFGRDKAREIVDGTFLIEHVARAARPHVSEIHVVAAVAGQYDDLGFETIGDIEPDNGPLGGLCTALGRLEPDERALLLSCDLLGLQSDWIAQLVKSASSAVEPACLFDTKPLQPLLACYSATLRGPAELRLANGRRSMQGLLDATEKELLPPPPGWERYRNINRPSDLLPG